MIEGGPGVGKSALMVEAARRARAGGLRALSLRGRPREQDAPFELLRRLFARPVASCSPQTRDELFAGAAAPAAVMFSGTAPEDDPGGGVERGDALVHAMHLLAIRIGDLDRVRRAGGRGGRSTRRLGLAILVDDVEWVDWCSLRVLVALAVEISTAPIALVCSCPPGRTSTNAVLLERLRATAAITLTPAPLSTAAVAGALRGAAPEMSASEAEKQAGDHVRDTRGNPLLLSELIADGVPLRRRPPHGASPRERSLRALAVRALARVEALPPTTRAVARALAVLGDDSTVAETAALAELGPPAIDRPVAQLVAARILAQPEEASDGGEQRLRFAHPLIGAAVRSELDPAERFRAHRRAAGLRHAAGAPPAVVAFHLLSCPPPGDTDAAVWLAEAVRHTAGLGHFRAIRELADRALAGGPPPALARRIRFDRALAGAALGATDAADQLEHVLQETADGVDRAALLLALARLLFTSKRFDEAGRALARAGTEVLDIDAGGVREGGPAAASSLTWLLLRDELAIATFRPDARAGIAARLPALVTEAADLTGASAGLFAQYAVQRAASGASRTEVRDLAVRGLRGDDGSAGADTGFAELGVRGDYFYDLRAGMSVMALLAVDEFDLAHVAIEKVLTRAQDNGSLIGIGFASHWRALLRLRRGRLLGAVSDAERTLGVCRIGWDVCRNSVAPVLVAAHLEGGRVDAAVRALAQTDPLDPDGDPVITQPGLVLEARGRVAAAQDRWADAHRLFLDAGAREREQVGIDPAPTMVPWRSLAAGAAARLGRLDEARTLAGEEVEIARGIGAPRTLAVALHVTGVVVGGGHGRALLREAVDLLADSQATVDRARVLLDYGVALAGHASSARDRETARDVLQSGLLLAERCGAHPVAERAVRALRTVGGRRPDSTSVRSTTTVTELTRTERHVAELAADHLSTPAIARALYVSPKTVEWHLTNAYRKLGVSSRGDLLAALNHPRPTG